MNAIEVSDLRLRRRGGFELGPLDLDLAAATRTAIVGPSGCGKTTLLRCLAGLERPSGGVVRIGGRVVEGGGTHVTPSARHIGFVFQDGALWPHLDAIGHLRFVDPGLSRADARARLEEVGLGDLATRRPGELSGGEAQRLALARALVGEPRILLLDEPLHSVDVHLRDALCVLIRRVAERHGVTLVVVTHDRDEALALAESIVVMRTGSIVEHGPARALLAEPATAFCASFLGGAQCIPARAAPFELPGDSTEDGAVLAVMPGDVELAEDGPKGRVVQIVPSASGAVAHVELGDVVLRVPSAPDLAPGAEVALRLKTTRILR